MADEQETGNVVGETKVDQTTPAQETENVVGETRVDGTVTEAEGKEKKKKIKPLETPALQIGGDDIVDFICNHLGSFIDQSYRKIMDWADHLESKHQVRKENREALRAELAEKSNVMRANEAYLQKKDEIKADDKQGKKESLDKAAEISRKNAEQKGWFGRTGVGQLCAGIKGRIQYNRLYREQLNNAALGNLPEGRTVSGNALAAYQSRHGKGNGNS
ncbi:MAG: hypothetical protein J5787_07130 [Alphaproteobacteria bacterium]|nr:hypothetical protein [Alphaproteobacteria bacterium]